MKSFSLTRPKKTASCFMRNRRCHGWSMQSVSLKRWQRVSHSVEAGQECLVDLESGFCQAAPAPPDSMSVACRPGFIQRQQACSPVMSRAASTGNSSKNSRPGFIPHSMLVPQGCPELLQQVTLQKPADLASPANSYFTTTP